MTEPQQPSAPEAQWIWAIDVPIDPKIPGLYRQHDTAKWWGGTALRLARSLAVQFDDEGPLFWRIRIYDAADPDGSEVLIYTVNDHARWQASPDYAEERAALLANMEADRQDVLARWRDGLSPWEAIAAHVADATPAAIDVPAGPLEEADAIVDRLMGPDMDAPPAEVNWHSGLAHALKRFERLMDNDGNPDTDKVLDETGHMLAHALTLALRHAERDHEGRAWTVCDDSAQLMAKVASVYVSSYLAKESDR